VIETSEETPHGQGWKYTFLFDNFHAVTMGRGYRKDRSEPQRRHDLLFHKSHHDPLTYYKTRLEDLSKTVEQYRRTVHVTEVDARHSKKALAGAQNQVGPLQS